MTLFLDTLFDDKYFSLIESSFIYLIKYLIVFAIINGNRKFIYKLKEAISKKRNFIANNRDCFILLLEDILIYYNSKNAKKNLEDCKNLMKNDYFMYEYIETFDKRIKEFMVENYLILNESIDIEEIKFILDEEKDENAKKILVEKIKYLYPSAEIKETDKKLEYEFTDDEINELYRIKTEDMYSITKNMVEFFKQNKNN